LVMDCIGARNFSVTIPQDRLSRPYPADLPLLPLMGCEDHEFSPNSSREV
jgi:hypothetical protein